MNGDYEMSEKELINNLIDQYVMLLEIKAANTVENKVLDRKILILENKLHTFGENTDKYLII